MKQLLLLLFVVFAAFGCKKDSGDYAVRVRVVTPDGIPIQNATVRMYAPISDPGAVDEYRFTDVDGYCEFEYKYKAFLSLDVVKGSWKGCDYVELMQGETVNKKLTIYPFGSPNGCPE